MFWEEVENRVGSYNLTRTPSHPNAGMTYRLRGCSPAQPRKGDAVESSSGAKQPPPPLAPVLAARLARHADAGGEGKVVEAGVAARPPTARKNTLSKRGREALELSESEGEQERPAPDRMRTADEENHSKVRPFPLVMCAWSWVGC